MPEITRFGPGNATENTGAGGVTWVDIDIADYADRAWLLAWQEINDQTRQALLEPVRFNHYEQVPDGTLLSVKMVRSGEMEDVTDLADLKLLIGSTKAVTLRSGPLVAVDELRQHLLSDRTLVTAVDLLGFLVSVMTNRMEAVIYDLTQDIDDVEDALLEGGSVPRAQTLSELRRRIFRTSRQVNATQQVLAPMTTDPALELDAEDRETLDRASNHVDRYLGGLDECCSRVQMLGDQIDAQRSEAMTRSSFHLTVVATVFLPLTFITGLLGMNVAGIPDQHNPYGFWLVTGLSVIISLLAWFLLRRRMQARYQYQDQNQYQKGAGKGKPGRLAGTSIRKGVELTAVDSQVSGEPSKLFDRPSDTEGGRQDRSDGAEVGKTSPVSPSTIVGVHVFALMLSLLLFYFHVVGIFDVIGEIYRGKKSLMADLGPQEFGKIVLLGCFLGLVVLHLTEAAVWGLFLRSMRLVSSVTEGIYFTAASITTLGYGDVLLKYPWRHLGTLIAITGVLTFGCSTAFLFVVLQDVWVGHL
jgi:zinc transporter